MAKKPSPLIENLILPDLATAIDEFDHGKPIGEAARISVVKENYSWKRGFVNCWTGWPNDGKSTFLMFMALMKSLVDGWKWCIWSPEMYNAYLDSKKKMVISANDLIDELVFMKTGLTPYKHFKANYGVNQMAKKDYVDAWHWINEHFVFVNVRDRKYNSLIDTFKFYHDQYNFNGFILDPWKNIDDTGESLRQDQFLKNAFAEIKQFSLESNSTFNIVAHPRSDKDPKNPDGSYKVCTQFSLSGGSEWNNGMDGIYTVARPFRHRNPQDPRVAFYNLKQRKQQLVGKCGVYDKIEFNFETNRYYFDGYCPIDGSYREPIDAREKRERAAAEAAKKNGEDPGTAKKKESGHKAKPTPPPIDFTEAQVVHEDENEPTF